jgi:hypothetical protein
MSGPVPTKYKDIQLLCSTLYERFQTVSGLVILLAGLAMHQDVKLLNNNGNYMRNAWLAHSVGVELCAFFKLTAVRYIISRSPQSIERKLLRTVICHSS